jgi:hypothetical protein
MCSCNRKTREYNTLVEVEWDLRHIYLSGLNNNPTVTDSEKGMRRKTYLLCGFRVAVNCCTWSEQLSADENKFDAWTVYINNNAEALQSKIPCFVWAKHIHRVPKGLLNEKMWDCQHIVHLAACQVTQVWRLMTSAVQEKINKFTNGTVFERSKSF